MRFIELDEMARRYALYGLTQIVKWALAQHAAQEHAAEAQRLQGHIEKLRADIAEVTAIHKRGTVGVMHTADGPRPIYDGAGPSRLLRLEEQTAELANLEEAKRRAEVERDSFLAVSRPGPDVIPGLAEWLTAHVIDKPEFRFKG